MKKTVVAEAPHLVQAALLKNVVEATRDLVDDDVSIRWNADSLTLRAIDSTKTVLVSVFFSAKTFANYRCNATISVAVSLNNIATVLTCAANDDVLVTVTPDALAQYITFSFQSPSILTISVTTECLRFYTKGDNCTGDITFKPGEATVIFMKKFDSVCLSFSLRYLNSLAKATSLSSRVMITLSKELPMGVLEYRFAHPQMMDAVCFYLKPVPTIKPEPEETVSMAPIKHDYLLAGVDAAHCVVIKGFKL
ncbi:hypothetical protein Fmac_030455 [Flemingia macrophylla]|uniref:DNA sliding clamp PCNA n=1 Tax=Flemingia macrophylla TaxID=520843 RepID=A0ABD1KZ88_9FABA